MRSTPKKDESLRQRLAEAVERFSEGSADDFGRKIGYANGGYVREALSGKKPVREALLVRGVQSQRRAQLVGSSPINKPAASGLFCARTILFAPPN